MSRTPPGVRGLKLAFERNQIYSQLSHPTRGAWIETAIEQDCFGSLKGRTPPGVRGLKPEGCKATIKGGSRTPPGVRGLKQTTSTKTKRIR